MSAGHEDDDQLGLLTVHALSWLATGNAVGLLLATLLLVPEVGAVAAPLTFGRWVPVHLDLQLYGWCGSIVLVLLSRVYMPARTSGRLPELVAGLWSASLLFAVVSSLAGHSSGKPFLEFIGPARAVLGATLVALEAVFVVAFLRQRREQAARGGPARRSIIAAKLALLALLATVPALMFVAASPAVYPPINPDSGGPTGASLLGSTLVVVAIVIAGPPILGLWPLRGVRELVVPAGLLVLHAAWFGALDHANHSSHEWLQVVSLASLVIWIPVLGRFLRGFDWPPAARPWLAAFCAWGAVLVLSGIATFLPATLERLRFTDALVGHAHLAMAGMLTSFGVLVLVVADRRMPSTSPFADRRAFVSWQVGCLLFIGSMTAVGLLDNAPMAEPLVHTAALPAALYLARWVAGAAMLWASSRWLVAAARRWSPA